jgi:hypothetical protein
VAGHRGRPGQRGSLTLGVGEGSRASSSQGTCPVLLHAPTQPTQPFETILIPKLWSPKSTNVVFWEQPKKWALLWFPDLSFKTSYTFGLNIKRKLSSKY